MKDRLLDRLGESVTFVVGKGGLGKTTTAGGIALALADAGVSAHLLSTDPAHSLADLFEQDLDLRPAPSRCTDRLVLEEVHGPEIARGRLDRLRPGLREIIDRGTYLDEADADSLLTGTLPGLDEVGAALRIAELAGGDGRLVVDTAPTGHTLRLLDTPSVVESWIRVFRAMAAKAGAVAAALVGAGIRLSGEAGLDRLAADMDRFRDAVVRSAFLVMTGPGPLAREETDRLLRALDERGLRVAATVAAARPGAEADVLLPVAADLRGCDALRRWLRGGAPPSSGGRRPAPDGWPLPPEPGGPTDLPAGIPDRSLLVLAGKGGVGKSTCAAALGVALARRGPVSLVGVDPVGSLADVLPDPPPELTVHQLHPERELERFRDIYRREVERAFEATGLAGSARMDREVAESLWALAPPGVDELVAVTRLAGDDVPGPVVLDTAPTGHFLRLIAMPDLALDWVHRLMRILLRYGGAGGLDAPAAPLLRLARRLRALSERLSDPSRTGIILVTLDEPLVRAETRRLARRLRERGLEPAAVILNRVRSRAAVDGPEAWTDGPSPTTVLAPEVEAPDSANALRAFIARWTSR